MFSLTPCNDYIIHVGPQTSPALAEMMHMKIRVACIVDGSVLKILWTLNTLLLYI